MRILKEHSNLTVETHIKQRESSLYLACNENSTFFTSEQPKQYKLWSCQKCMMLSIIFGYYIYKIWLEINMSHEKTCLWEIANNKGADQSAHLQKLIIALVSLLENFISKLASSEISVF